MMFGRQAVAKAGNIFKWKPRGESLLSTSLLGGLPSEIELSDHGRLPTPDNESPRLPAEETLNLEPIADLDLFFERLYNYYCEKGLWCIIIKWIVELLTLGFTICFSGFFLLFVDWNGLRSAKCGMDAVESGIKPCDLAREALHEHPLIPFTLTRAVIVGYLGIFSVYWVFCFLRFFAQLKDILGIRQFYHGSLHVSDNEIQTMPWASVLEKVVKLQSSYKLCIVKDLTEHDIVMRLMRKHNYLVGMLNKGVLAFPISHWLPGCGPAVKVDPHGVQHRLILTKTLEWSLNWCILQNMFDRNCCVKRDFISSPEMLKKRLMVVGLGMLVLSPFLVIFLLVYLFLRHAEQFYNHPSTASSRRWSNLSRWMFREFNEVDHLFKHRMNSSVLPASDYLKQFPSPIISIVAKFISFISGGFAAVLIIIAFLEESLLEGHIFGRNLLWYAAVFGTITAISRAMVADEILLHDHYRAMSLVVQHTHYMPKRWRGKECSETVRLEFDSLFQYTGMMLLEEMASILLTPYLLLFVVPKHVDDILQFIADFTVHIEGVGHVCSFSLFDFNNHGNMKYGSPFNSGPKQRSSQGKMEKSLLSFHQCYPSWVPDAQGKKFLLNVRMFVKQKLEARYNHSFRGLPQANLNTPFSYDCPPRSLDVTGDEYHHYLLDWYYTSSESHPVAEEQSEDLCPPSHLTRHVTNKDDYRSEASTSMPFLGSVLCHHDPGIQHHFRSQWWARSHAQGSEPQGSFLEPPEFGLVRGSGLRAGFMEAPELTRDNRWEAEMDVEQRDSSRLTRTVFMDDFEDEGEGEVSLHFDGVYERPPGPVDIV